MSVWNDIGVVALKGFSRNVVDCKIDLHIGISILFYRLITHASIRRD